MRARTDNSNRSGQYGDYGYSRMTDFEVAVRWLCVAEGEDCGAEFCGFFGADAGDGLKLGEGVGTKQYDAAQGGGAEDEELGKADALGFGLAPCAERFVEELLGGSEGGGGVGGWGGAGAVEADCVLAVVLNWSGWLFDGCRC